MTFEKYWEEKGHLGSNPEEVAHLAWDAAIVAEREAWAPSMLKELDDYDWCEVFGEGSGNTSAIKPTRIPGEKCSLDSFGRKDVAEILGISEGERDESDWMIWGKLKDGRFFVVTAGCDYTGWDCRAWNDGNVAETKENLIQFAMSDAERSRFGLSL